LSVNKRSAKPGKLPGGEANLAGVENGLAHGCSSGYAEEARAFGELAMTRSRRRCDRSSLPVPI
jgi:hypothetical protein